MTNGNHPTTERQNMKRVLIRLPPDLVEALKERAAALPEETVSAVARRLIRYGLAAEAAA
jgi:hypothetical protein